MLFAAARAGDCTFFFDEADALFGRRGQPHQSRNRYANMEVSHLLACMHDYPGVCIVGVDSQRNLSPESLRRFRVILNVQK